MSDRPTLISQLLGLQELPTLPHVVGRIIEMTSDPRSGANDLNQVIMNDQAIAAKILKLANSAFYGLPGRVTTLNRAITLLGFNTVRSLALSISVIHAFQGKTSNPHFDRGRFWEHSLAVAAASKILAAKRHSDLKEDAHTAGLFHDIGRLILDQYFNEYFTTALELSASTGQPSWVVERQILGADHGEIGAQVAEHWNFPAHLVEVIRNHHDPSALVGNPLGQIVALADYLACEMGYGDPNDLTPMETLGEAFQTYCGTGTEREILRTKLEAEVERAAEILSLFR